MRIIFILVVLISLIALSAESQHQHPPSTEPGKHEELNSMETRENLAREFLMSEGAGTATNPRSMPMSMLMKEKSGWDLMAHGYLFLNDIQQSGPRGEDQFFSTNHLMLMAQRRAGQNGSLLIRSMLSLEPATVSGRKYAELFQTGETAYGNAIVDAQHPHDFFMEISVQYALSLRPDTLIHLYAAPVGDPALGPVAFPHRISAQELPQATLSHHVQDSTHIANDVFTAGVEYKWARLEFSGFHGGEPDEGRWDIDYGKIDSWSTRLTLAPGENWTAQVSYGELKKPEELEPGDIRRTTASATYYQTRSNGFFAFSALWGTNHKLFEDIRVYSFGVEALYQFQAANNLTARFEVVDKEELFAGQPEVQEEFESQGITAFRIKAFTVGYARDFNFSFPLQVGIGANLTMYSFPDQLDSYYSDNPKGVLFYVRLRSAHHGRPHGEMHH